MKKFTLLLVSMLLVAGVSAQSVRVMNLWPKGAPHRGNPNDTAKVWIYLPAENKVTGRSIVICPGGGYSGLALDHEGHEWAKFFQNMGITAFVLKYRMPNGKPEVPIEDAEEILNIDELKKQTEQGDASVQCNLEYCYEYGEGVRNSFM